MSVQEKVTKLVHEFVLGQWDDDTKHLVVMAQADLWLGPGV